MNIKQKISVFITIVLGLFPMFKFALNPFPENPYVFMFGTISLLISLCYRNYNRLKLAGITNAELRHMSINSTKFNQFKKSIINNKINSNKMLAGEFTFLLTAFFIATNGYMAEKITLGWFFIMLISFLTMWNFGIIIKYLAVKSQFKKLN